MSQGNVSLAAKRELKPEPGSGARPAAAAVINPVEPSADAEPQPSAATTVAPAPRRRSKRKLVLTLATASALLGGGSYWYGQRAIESTDDAQVDADLVAVAARTGGTVKTVYFEENQQVEPGQLLAELEDAPAKAKLAQAQANLAAAEAAAHAADAQAQLAQRNARGNLAVAAAGLHSSTVGAQSSSAQINEAQARIQNAQAHLLEAEQNLARTERLFDGGAASSAQLDQQRSAHEVARTELARAQAALATVTLSRDQAQTRVAEAQAKLTQSDQVEALIREAEARAEQAHAAAAVAQAQLDLAKLDLSYTKIYAPNAGVVSKKNLNAGQIIALGQSIAQLVPSTRWVTANFKETQLDRMRVGQPVELKIDAYPSTTFHGHVASFSGATGSRFALLPPDNATGNFTKVVQRVSVRVQLDALRDARALEQLRPGMSAEVHVNTAADSGNQDHAARAHGV